ncbi:MAG TPA: hypothetical protein VGQ59_01560 [Cyclobacteriaceae bacterium]|nr:hypothetical protein [Cyclobacteriaceae bacterium]
MPKRKVTKEKDSTNTAPPLIRLATTRARVGRAVRARPRAKSG